MTQYQLVQGSRVGAGFQFSSLSGAMSNVWLAGRPKWVPAHSKAGKEINDRLLFAAYAKLRPFGKGEPLTEVLDFVLWGPLCPSLCWMMSPGRALNVSAQPRSYYGGIWENNQPVIGANGQPLQVRKINFLVDKIECGPESSKIINGEIQEGTRPVDWDKIGPNRDAWLKKEAAKRAVAWDGKANTYGYADVLVPTGHGIVLTVKPEPSQATYVQPNYQQQAQPNLPNTGGVDPAVVAAVMAAMAGNGAANVQGQVDNAAGRKYAAPGEFTTF